MSSISCLYHMAPRSTLHKVNEAGAYVAAFTPNITIDITYSLVRSRETNR